MPLVDRSTHSTKCKHQLPREARVLVSDILNPILFCWLATGSLAHHWFAGALVLTFNMPGNSSPESMAYEV